MNITCNYFGNGNFNGYFIWVDEQYDRLCYLKDNYYDIVIDYLNNDIKSLKGYSIAFYDRVEEKLKKELDLPDVVDWCNAVNKRTVALHATVSKEKALELMGTPNLWDKSFALYSQTLKEIEAQINAMPVSIIKNLVNHTLVDNDDEISNLDSLTRFTAFYWAFKDEFSLKFSQTVDFLGKVEEKSELKRDKWARNVIDILEETTSSEVAFKKICQLEMEYKNSFIPSASYSFNSMSDMILFFISEMIKMNCKVKICPNCGRYFVPQNRSDEVYCRNTSPQDKNKTCQEYGKYMTYLEKSRTDEATKLYKQIYNAKANKVKRTSNDVLRADLNIFRERAKIWRSDVKSGVASEDDYITWLKSVKAGENNGEH